MTHGHHNADAEMTQGARTPPDESLSPKPGRDLNICCQLHPPNTVTDKHWQLHHVQPRRVTHKAGALPTRVAGPWLKGDGWRAFKVPIIFWGRTSTESLPSDATAQHAQALAGLPVWPGGQEAAHWGVHKPQPQPVDTAGSCGPDGYL